MSIPLLDISKPLRGLSILCNLLCEGSAPADEMQQQQEQQELQTEPQCSDTGRPRAQPELFTAKIWQLITKDLPDIAAIRVFVM